MFFVYIPESESSDRFHVGECDNLIDRFHRHHSGHGKATRGRGPRSMPYYGIFQTGSEAVAWEQSIKVK